MEYCNAPVCTEYLRYFTYTVVYYISAVFWQAVYKEMDGTAYQSKDTVIQKPLYFLVEKTKYSKTNVQPSKIGKYRL